MRIVITGATGNVGTSVLRHLATDGKVQSICAIARRLPRLRIPKTEWCAADITTANLEELFAGADAILHLAWAIQPERKPKLLDKVNVDGSRRVFEAAAAAGAGALIYASSVGVYSPGAKDRMVDESWPTEGIPTALYSRQKAAVEKILDRVEAATPAMRVARMRPALIFKRDSASEQQRYFLGPLFPNLLARPGWVPFVPSNERLRFQAVHSRDVGAAFHLATMHPEARGAFNLAADPVLDGERLARILRTRELHVPPRLMRVLASIAWHLRLEPASPGWLDLAFNVPLMDSRRARTELGWHPRRSAELTILEVMRGLADHAGLAGSPPLAAR